MSEEISIPVNAPPQMVADYVVESSPNKIQHPEEQVGFCIECHPFDEPILTAQHGYVQIGDLDPTKHRLVVYSQEKDRVRPGGNARRGYEIEQINYHEYSGDLFTITTPTFETRVTPNHWVTIRWSNKACSGAWFVYLMNRGAHWRIGKAKLIRPNKNRVNGDSGIKKRLNEEGADAIWILKIFDNPKDALFFEQLWSVKYSIPGLVFRPSQYPTNAATQNTDEEVESFYSQIDSAAGAQRILDELKLDINLPFLTRDNARKFGHATGWTIRAANLIEGFMEVPTYTGTSIPTWQTFLINRSIYNGLVYNLEILPFHHYIANGIIVHNCKSIQPDQHMIRSPFFESGASIPCRFCGGVTIITFTEVINDKFNSRLDQSRGL